MKILTEHDWGEATAAHEARVDSLTAGHVARRAGGRTHPVEDFLFTYYGWKPGQLRRWHPGAGVGLSPADLAPQSQWRFYRAREEVVSLDVAEFLGARGDTVHFVRELLVRTAERPGRFGCFGLHEWAMVYRLPQSAVRHAAWPLRLGQQGTDAVVEAHQISCSHYDAYRFFTPEAAPRNLVSPTRATQTDFEQPGCLHAGMDLYKWAMKLSPAVGTDLALDAFELARDIRELDMRASPYDLRGLGYDPVPIETSEGKSQYVEEQRAFAFRSAALRTRLVAVIDSILEPDPCAD